MKNILSVCATVFLFVCSQSFAYGNVVGQLNTVQEAGVVGMQPVRLIQESSGVSLGGIVGAIVGGVVGHAIGGGAKYIATGVMAVAGGIAGQKLSSGPDEIMGTRFILRLRYQQSVSLIQVQYDPSIHVGSLVRLIQENGNTIIVPL